MRLKFALADTYVLFGPGPTNVFVQRAGIVPVKKYVF